EQRSSVDLPLPFAPRRTVSSPGQTSRSTSFRTGGPPPQRLLGPPAARAGFVPSRPVLYGKRLLSSGARAAPPRTSADRGDVEVLELHDRPDRLVELVLGRDQRARADAELRVDELQLRRRHCEQRLLQGRLERGGEGAADGDGVVRDRVRAPDRAV